MAHAKHTEGRNRPLRISITVNNRYAFETDVVTGKQIKEKANIPAGFAIYRRMRGGNEPILDDASVELHDGDHFFARPPGSPRAHGDDEEGISR